MQRQHLIVPLAYKTLGRVEANTGVVAGAAGEGAAADPAEILGLRKVVSSCLKIFVQNCEIRDKHQ